MTKAAKSKPLTKLSPSFQGGATSASKPLSAVKGSTQSPAEHSAKSTGERTVEIREAPIELAQLLKFAGLFESGGQAKQAVVDGEVKVNGAVESRKGRKLVAGDKVTVGEETVVVAVE